MYIEQLYTGCLSEAAYYIESDGEAAIIDPLRDIDEYLYLANERKTRIKYIFETHFHADFVSGHIDLGKVTGAPIVYGPKTETKFPVHVAKDGEKFSIGKITIEVLHTPGHTLESSCYLLKDENGKDHCVFTGDTLFVNGVGRPDLRDKSIEFSENLYDTLYQKIMILPSYTVILPSHFDKDVKTNELLSSTLGELKEKGIFLNQQLTREQFIQNLSAKVMVTPPNYLKILSINKGEKLHPSSSEIFELEIGPNRCSISYS